jgi:hypothetical protein
MTDAMKFIFQIIALIGLIFYVPKLLSYLIVALFGIEFYAYFIPEEVFEASQTGRYPKIFAKCIGVVVLITVFAFFDFTLRNLASDFTKLVSNF